MQGRTTVLNMGAAAMWQILLRSHLGGYGWCYDPGRVWEVSQDRREKRFGSRPEANENLAGEMAPERGKRLSLEH